MATVRRTFDTPHSPQKVWEVFRDFGAVHRRLAPGFVTDTKVEAGARMVTFANGFVARELLVSMDDAERRLAYAIVSEPFQQHSASFQVLEAGEGGSRVIWIADFLPDGIAGQIESMMDQGCAAMQRTLSQ